MPRRRKATRITLQAAMIHCLLLALLGCLLALAPPVSAHTPNSPRPLVPPPVALFAVEFGDAQDCGPLTLHLDGLHDRAGPCGGVLVRQNPWSKFDPEGLGAIGVAKKMLGKTDEAAAALKKINGRMPIHSEWAGKKVTPGMLPDTIPNKAHIAEKYPDGVHYTKEGRPDFTPHAAADLNFNKGELSGDMYADVSAARTKLMTERKLSLEQVKAMEAEHTWHHVEGGQGMQLVPQDLHDAYRHTGGRADIKAGNWFTKAGAFLGGIFAGRRAEAKQKGTDVATATMQDAVTYLPVIGDGLDVMGQGLDMTDKKLNNVIRPNNPDAQYNMLDRMLKE